MPQSIVPATININNKSEKIATNSSTLDSLPKQFVTAMRTLFDIMDDKHTGYVNFADIEHRWQDDGTKGLPKGVIESLQKVTPPNGMLSFERFCAGLKICLLRNQVEKTTHQQSPTSITSPNGNLGITHINKQRSIDSIINNGNNSNQPMIINSNRPPSAPLLDIDCTTPKSSNHNNNMSNHNNNRTNMSQQRALSMPQLLSERNKENLDNNNLPIDKQSQPPQQQPSRGYAEIKQTKQPPQLYGPPKPPRVGLVDKSEIRTALQNWQMGLMINEQEAKEKQQRSNGPSSSRIGRGAGDGKPATQSEMQSQQQQQPVVVQAGGVKKPNVRRREPRRHTLQNGIDYNMLKRMKQIEQEKDVLMQGLNAIEKARDWYLKQVASVQEKMKYLGRMGSHMEQWSETQQERLELQRARVLEVNRHLATLTCSWERGGLPLHMNLAVHHHQDNMLNRLKQQNHLLTEEVSKKSERITLLEREKAALIRELLQMRAQPRSNTNTQIQQEEAVF
ncbi:suppressor APC domain-containing protein 2 isoform X2 [Chrysoperla carnea]|uniref:suppressor APC domain-containing protein 2 isoform X2 n=1 Tax=Chrysoperla carnea TaxID=189513 RepID=UPI001D08A6E8|nr:suppressor APC domain-containing protein 2 isoform X2 [Chrysoperla carnea]